MTPQAVSLGDELVARRRELERGECEWLLDLDQFNRSGDYAADGALSCTAWLTRRCGMARATAHEKLRIATELHLRPVIRDAFLSGELSYSQVRAITRLVGCDEETDRMFLGFAKRLSADRLEQAVRYRRRLQEQDRDPNEFSHRWERRGASQFTTFEGMGITELVVPEEEHVELTAIIDGEIESEISSQKSSAEDSRTYRQRRADAIASLIRRGHAASGRVDGSGHDRFTLNVVCTLDQLLERGNTGGHVLGGAPISVETLRRVACDTSIVRHVLKGRSEPIDIGRKSPVWTAAQRRDVRLRDDGHCRFPGCPNTTCDIHHIEHWGRGGPTNVSNGALKCPRHHTMVHEGGWTVEGNANGSLTYISPTGERFLSPVPIPLAQWFGT